MDVLGLRSGSVVLLSRARQLALEQLQASLDVDIGRVKICGASVGVKRIGDLIVARFVQCAQIVPNLGDVGVQTDGTGVGIEGVTVLVDLVVEDTDRAPEGRVATVAIDCLLVGLVCLGVFLHRHVAATKKVPTLCIVVI
jgi:hypothetical protein